MPASVGIIEDFRTSPEVLVISPEVLVLTIRLSRLYLNVLLGIDGLVLNHFKNLKNAKVGLCTNISSCNRRLRPTIKILEEQKSLELSAVFTPEHGLFGALQDQEKSGNFYDRPHKIAIQSLYGKRLWPSHKALSNLDVVVIDLQDIGTRYYTFVWTAILLVRQMAKIDKPVLVLDRPNPLNGDTIEGPVLDKRFSSFVGLYPIPVRHGMTIAELINLINKEYDIGADIQVVRMKGWQRQDYFDATGQFWTIPSPNMPSFFTALVYPGMCLFEGTNISEGRGTTRPFEIIGAPWVDPFRLVRVLEKENISGAIFRPTFFIPTFNKYCGQRCGGTQLHIENIKKFMPLRTGLTIIKTIRDLYPNKFAWRKPPYEFERKKLPFDILIGNSWVRQAIENRASISSIEKKWQPGINKFRQLRKKYLLYD